MDQIAAVLLDFPPPGGLADDVQYHAAAHTHSQKVERLMVLNEFREHALQLLDVRSAIPQLCLQSDIR